MGYSANITPTMANLYAGREVLRSHRAVSLYTLAVQEGRTERRVHAQMDPAGVRRESRDSEAHPESLAIGVMFDVTGSMGQIPREVQRRLVNLMSMLSTRGYVDHPQVLFGAVGDATCDVAPTQVGQFEAGIDMDEDLERVFVESGGGGGKQESYELAHYFFARHVVADCWERRAKKGYLFTLGDEAPYPTIPRSIASKVFGDSLQAELTHEEVLVELQEKWNVFHLLMKTTTSESTPSIGARWRALLPEGHVIGLSEGKNVAEVVGLIIGIMEGRAADARSDLSQLGIDGQTIAAVLSTLAPLARSRGIRLND